jgi:SAM-dependent methyltransferase
MRTIACVMMQKDEAFLLRPWLAYHGYLFGFENLFVMDNGSTLADVRATLLEFAGNGVHVDWDHASREDYLAKGDLIGDRLRSLDATGEYDFLIPLDCDEFIVLRTEAALVWRREPILTYLATLVGERRVLRFPYQLANHPLNPDIYHRYDFFKVFFPSGTVAPMDHGHHLAHSGLESKDTRLLHLHFHHKVFSLKTAQARLSWVGTVDVDDRTELAVYDGPSAHLNRFFLQGKDEYYRGFLDMVHFFLPEFRALLRDLGAPLDLPTEAVADDLRLHITEVDTASNSDTNGVVVVVPLTAAGATTTGEFRTTRFHEGHYLQANPGLVEAAVDPTIHFSIHGFRESRLLRPVDEAAAMARIAAYLAGDGPRCLELGAGGAPPRPGWLATDLRAAGDTIKLDVTRRFPVPDRSFDRVHARHLIEQLSFVSGRFMLAECFRVMKPGGTLRIVTPSIGFLLELFAPDRSALADRYLKWATETFVPDAPAPMPCFAFNNYVHDRGYRFLYDRTTMEWILTEAGFVDIRQHTISVAEATTPGGLEANAELPALESMILEATRPHDPIAS